MWAGDLSWWSLSPDYWGSQLSIFKTKQCLGSNEEMQISEPQTEMNSEGSVQTVGQRTAVCEVMLVH